MRFGRYLLIFLAAVSAEAQSLDGIWRSRGYGFVFEIQGTALKAFEVTTATCVPSFTATRQQDETFKSTDGDIFFFRKGGEADHKRLHFEGAASDIRMDRLTRMPAVCDRLTENTPLGNFDVFAHTWSEHYILFDLKHTNWNQIVAAHRSKVTAKTTPIELFEIFKSMIEPFNDLHTFLNTPELKRQFRGKWRPGTDRVVKADFETKGRQALFAVTDRAYIRRSLKKFCNDQIQYGYTDPGMGYLRILSFGDYVKHGDFAKQLEALETTLDEIFSDSEIKALIVDMRLSFGGADPFGLAIASRLATREYLAYTKYARADPTDRDKWTPGDPSLVRPTARPGFRGPVVMLTGPIALSAAETFTQSLMGRTPHVTRIGENTQGIFSDVLVRKLPNGWIFGLPNEVFRTPEGTAFDGTGIPPDIEVPVFADRDIAAGKDPAMEKALEILRKK